MRHIIMASGLLLCGCPNGNDPTTTATTATASAAGTTSVAATSAAPATSSSAPVSPATMPTTKPYAGPSGTIKGVIKITGDAPPLTDLKYPKGCEAASGVYGKLFRVGQDGQLADAAVMVTDYGTHYIKPEKQAVRIDIKNCAFHTRTVGMTDGQFLEIHNNDVMTSYLPHLDGARMPATIVAIPRGPSVKVYSRGRGRYWLRDQMTKTFMVAHVFHFPYSTFDVTGLDGRYEIKGVPVGKAKINVMLPQTKTMKSISKAIEVIEGENIVDLELTFDAKADTPDDGHGNTKPKR
jgi:hypothetical protein